MKRQKATELVLQVLERAVAGTWPANLATEIRVFGSYMRGALEPQDVDLAYKFKGFDDPRWRDHWHDKFFAGQDPMATVRKSLRGTSRGISLTLLEADGAGYEDIPNDAALAETGVVGRGRRAVGSHQARCFRRHFRETPHD